MVQTARVRGHLSVISLALASLPGVAQAQIEAEAIPDESVFASFEDEEGAVSREDLYSQPTRIVGGRRTKMCHWPAAAHVSLGNSLCTGSLVHPQIVITAGHCNAGIRSVSFAEDVRSQINAGKVKKHRVEYCKSHPSWVSESASLNKHVDYSFCKLAEPVTDVPITPIMMGCETEYLKEKPQIVAVGFGKTSANNPSSVGTKREVVTKVARFASNGEVVIGSSGKGSCNGDSGGPLYVKLPEDKFGKDAGWRVFGVTSWGDTSCPGPTNYGLMHRFVPFVEKTSGIDITPCTDAEGNWEPGEDCKGAPLDPAMASGTWSAGCEAGPVGGFISSCGDPFGGAEEKEVEVTIDSPGDGDSFEGGEKVKVVVEAEVEDGKIAEVTLSLDGDEQAADKSAPFEWSFEDLEAGEHELQAVAVDEDGNEGKSETVSFTVEEKGDEDEPEDDEDEPDDTTTEPNKDSSSDTSKEDDDGQPEDADSDDEDEDGKDSEDADSDDEDEDSGTESSSNNQKMLGKRERCQVSSSTPGFSMFVLLFAGVLRRRKLRKRSE